MQGFDWDDGNKDKNWIKHKVSAKECEEVFFNKPIVVYKDVKHSTSIEERLGILGKTNQGRKLHIIYVIREEKIRIVSARDQNKKERKYFESQK